MNNKKHLPLTRFEQDIYNAIEKYFKGFGYMPTRKEIAELAKQSSIGSSRQLIQQSLRNMELKGYLKLGRGWRKITLL